MAENKLKRTRRTFELDVTSPMSQSQAISVVVGHGNQYQEFCKPCCPKSRSLCGCFLSHFSISDREIDYVAAAEFLIATRELTRNKSSEEKNATLVRLFQKSMSDSDLESKRLRHTWIATVGDKTLEVCRDEWCFLYNFTKNSLKRCSELLRVADVVGGEAVSLDPVRDYDFRTYHDFSYRETVAMFKANLPEYSPDMIKCALTPSSDIYESAVAWFTEHFDSCADVEPNREECQLDVIDKIELYDIYVVDSNLSGLTEDVLCYQEWLRVWHTVFPNVKVRAYKQVTGKCWVCFHINDGRRRCRDQANQKALKQLHQLHRGGLYMLERSTYKARARFAVANSDRVCSLIIDGMDQQHCLLPHMANQTSLSEALHQHLTGVIMHGFEAVLYRTFGNVNKGANLTIYCILAQLERWSAEHGGAYPEELYVQVDGGSENANKYVLALLELLTVKRLVRVVYLTRLPTGHTHEDIDAIFAKIWEWFKANSVMTPKEYATELKKAFAQSASVHLRNIRVEDIFIIPDMTFFASLH
jgi:hypothetical protein